MLFRSYNKFINKKPSSEFSLPLNSIFINLLNNEIKNQIAKFLESEKISHELLSNQNPNAILSALLKYYSEINNFKLFRIYLGNLLSIFTTS